MKTTTARTPIRTEPIRTEPIRAKVRVRKNSGTKGPLDIDPSMIPDGVDLMWVADSINGQPCPQYRASFEINAWEPVLPEMFDGRFDGMFTKKGHQGEINVGGQVLMWRPLELTLEARGEENRAAMQAVQAEEQKLASGEIQGITFDTRHPSARANTHIGREMVPGIPVPR